MAAKRSPKVKADIPDRDQAFGYSANAESKFTRRASDGGAQPTYTVERQQWTKLDFAIDHQARVVERLERRAIAARGIPELFNPICVRLQRTRTMLERMRAERAEKELVK